MTALKEGDEVAGSFVEEEIGLVIGDWGAEDPLQRVACGWHATHSRVRVCEQEEALQPFFRTRAALVQHCFASSLSEIRSWDKIENIEQQSCSLLQRHL